MWSKNHSYQGISATLLLRESQNPPVAGPSTCAKSCEAHHHLIQHSSFRAQRWDLVKGLHRANLSHWDIKAEYGHPDINQVYHVMIPNDGSLHFN